MPEHFWIAHGHVGEDFAVELDASGPHRSHEPAVRDTRLARRGVDARDPQRAELRLPLPAVAIGVVQRMERRLAGGTDELVLRPAASLSLFEELLVLLVSGDPALDSCHASPTAPSQEGARMNDDE